MAEERIGNYRVHPAAQLFPIIETTDSEALKSSIEHHGQQQPIIVQGDVLLDGRNRLYACRALGIAPRIVEYSGPLTPLQLIETLNLHRRDLSADQRASIQAAILGMHQAERAAAAQKAGGEQHGSGRKKATTISSEPISEPKTRARARPWARSRRKQRCRTTRPRRRSPSPRPRPSWPSRCATVA